MSGASHTLDSLLSKGVRSASGCLEWPGKLQKNGYGVVRYRRKDWRVHRLSHYLSTGESPEVVRHRCDNRKCFEPSHLEGGTSRDNTQDAVLRGRIARGERQGSSKLNDEAVKAIRWMCDHGYIKRQIAAAYNVSPATITNIHKGLVWRG